MLHLLNPLGLMVLAAGAVPLYLHLRRRPLRVVRLGSLAFIDARSRPRFDRLLWRRRLLLALRLCLVCAVALLASGPQWLHRQGRPRRWALLAPGAVLEGPALGAWRRAVAEGFEPRMLEPGFPEAVANLGAAPSERALVWSLLSEADSLNVAGSSLLVFAPLRLASLSGLRPTLAHATVRWIDVQEAHSSPTQSAGNTPDKPALRIVISYEPSRRPDARAVEAALRAVSAVSGRRFAIDSNPGPGAFAGADWMFQLGPAGDREAAETQSVAEGASLFTDGAGDPRDPGAGSNLFVVATAATEPGRFASTVGLRKRTDVEGAGAVLWRDALGKPVLTLETKGRGHRYRFFSRFNPAWSSWTLEGVFPLWVGTLVLPEWTESGSRPDLRRADPEQARLETRADLDGGASLAGVVPLGRYLFWALLGLFLAERFVAHMRAGLPPHAQEAAR